MAQAGPFAAIAFHNLVEEDQFGSVFRLDRISRSRRNWKLSQGISDLRAGRRPLSLQSSWSSDVRPPGGEAPFRHRRSRPEPDWTHAELVDRLRGMQALATNSRSEHRAGRGNRHARALVGGARKLIVGNSKSQRLCKFREDDTSVRRVVTGMSGGKSKFISDGDTEKQSLQVDSG